MGWTVHGVVSLGGRRFNLLTESIDHPWFFVYPPFREWHAMHFALYADTDMTFLELDSATNRQSKTSKHSREIYDLLSS